jgi:hypothetical protein
MAHPNAFPLSLRAVTFLAFAPSSGFYRACFPFFCRPEAVCSFTPSKAPGPAISEMRAFQSPETRTRFPRRRPAGTDGRGGLLRSRPPVPSPRDWKSVLSPRSYGPGLPLASGHQPLRPGFLRRKSDGPTLGRSECLSEGWRTGQRFLGLPLNRQLPSSVHEDAAPCARTGKELMGGFPKTNHTRVARHHPPSSAAGAPAWGDMPACTYSRYSCLR